MSLLERLNVLFPALSRVPAGSWIVGGAVRDVLMGRDPADVDIASPDPLAAAQAIRKRVIRLGKEQLSAYRVVDGQHVYDFAEIEGGDIKIDLARRDFTVNAMAIDLATGELLDPFGGARDVENRIVRMVRESNFDDDPLRTLRGVRTAVRYDMTIEPATLSAIRSRAHLIDTVAPERVTYELSVILSSGRLRNAISLLRETQIDLGLNLREVHEDDVPLAAALAILVEDPRRWRWSEPLVREVLTLKKLIEHHDRIALYDAGEDIARQLPPLLRALGRDDTLDWPDFSIKPLLTGDEIAAIKNIAPGPELGRIKRELLEAQIRGEVTTRDEATALVSRRPLPP